MILTSENYHSSEARQEYLGVSQYKDFAGCLGRGGCEAMAMAKVRGEYEQELTTPLLVGSYVDAHFEGTLNVFKAQNPQIFTRLGGLKAEYDQANEIIARIEDDEYFMRCLSGQKQTIMTFELFGAKWKIKIDSYLPGIVIVDLKVMRSLRSHEWVKDYGKMNFIEYWGYDIQAAIYQVGESIVNKGLKLPFLIAAASKEKVTDIEVIGFDQQKLEDMLIEVEQNVPRILELKSGKAIPVACGKCDYCKPRRVLTGPIHYSELLENI